MPEQKKKSDSLLTLKENHLKTLVAVIRSSERIENLRRDIGVLGWKMKTLEESLTKSEPFLTPITWNVAEKSLNRRLTNLEKLMGTTVGIVGRFEMLTLRQSMDRTASSLHNELALCPSASDMMAMLDGRMVEIKEFVGNIVKVGQSSSSFVQSEHVR